MQLRQRLRIAFEHDLAAREKQHPVADRLDLDHVVARPQDPASPAFDDLADAGADVARGRRVDRGGRLVEQEESRAVQHRFRKPEPRLLARRQYARLCPAVSFKIVGREQFLDPPGQVLDRVDHAEDAKVLLDSEIARKGGVDGGEIRAGERPAAVGAKVDALDRNPPGGWLEHAENHVDRRRLAGAVRPEEPHDLAGRHMKGDVVDGLQAPERLGEALDGQDRRRRTHRPVVSDRAATASRRGRVSGLSGSTRRAVDPPSGEARSRSRTWSPGSRANCRATIPGCSGPLTLRGRPRSNQIDAPWCR